MCKQVDFTHAQRRDVLQGVFDYARLTSSLSRLQTQRFWSFKIICSSLYCSTDLDVLNYVSFVSHGRKRRSDSFNLRTPLCKTCTFQASYFNRIVKLWNYVCKLAPPTSFARLMLFNFLSVD